MKNEFDQGNNIRTERLTLSPCTLEDCHDIYDYAKNPNVGPHAGWAAHSSLDETKQVIEDIFIPAGSWAIREKGNPKVIGIIGLENDRLRPDANSREIGYSLAEEFWGRGYMTEATKAVMEYGFLKLGLDQIGIATSKVNIRSQRVIEKCGFVYEGTIRRIYKIYDGTLRDSMIFSILKEEWLKNKAND